MMMVELSIVQRENKIDIYKEKNHKNETKHQKRNIMSKALLWPEAL
jgi:hypothetical protein